MGQQQILFVILVVCIIAIAVSVGVISLSGHAVSDHRALLADDLNLIAKKVQDYVTHPVEQGDESNSFFFLSRMPGALNHLKCASTNAHGDFFVKKSINSSSLQIVGVGIVPGYDQKRPMRMMITVWAHRTALSELN